MKKAEFQLETLTCPTCIKKIEGTLAKIAGVTESKVLFNSSKVKLKLDESKTNKTEIQAMITKLGYRVLSSKVS